LCYADRRGHNHLLVVNLIIICIAAAVTARRFDRKQLFLVIFINIIFVFVIVIISWQCAERFD
jgi:uncharacterized membrane protein YvlD (DUF360 family)